PSLVLRPVPTRRSSDLYLLLRNPAVLEQALSAPEAVAVVQSYRQHPRWKILGFPPTSREIHADLWQHAATPGLARRRIYDTRIRSEEHTSELQSRENLV